MVALNMIGMVRCGIAFCVALLLPDLAVAQVSLSARTTYESFAAGIPISRVEAGFSFTPSSYKMDLGYRTTGMIGFLFKGYQHDVVEGAWRGNEAMPSVFLGIGHWHGDDRKAEINYRAGYPVVQTLIPPNSAEREPVPEALLPGTIDTMSALAQLVRIVNATGRCDTTAKTFDGRRAVNIQAHTVGEETLEPTSRSSFHGPALRCDFEGRLIAGFRFSDDHDKAGKPRQGSAWFARVAGSPALLPVKMSFETDWFGDAVMYLTDVAPAAAVTTAR